MRCPRLKDLPFPPANKEGWPWTEETPPLPDTMPDGRPWPRISIVTPSYNQAEFIEETIRSVLLQGYPDIEYIIIDGGSTDGSVEIIKKYEPWLTYWVSEPDRGQSHAINKGMERTTGKILNWLCSDDILLPSALKIVAEKYAEFPEAGAWAGGTYRISSKGKMLDVNLPKDLTLEGIVDWEKNYLPQSGCFFSRKAWEVAGPLDEELHYSMDFDLRVKIAKHFNFVKIEEIISSARIHADTKTQSSLAKMFAERCLVWSRHGYEEKMREAIVQRLRDYKEISRKLILLEQVASHPLLRPFKPLFRFIWKKLL